MIDVTVRVEERNGFVVMVLVRKEDDMTRAEDDAADRVVYEIKTRIMDEVEKKMLATGRQVIRLDGEVAKRFLDHD